jgi:uncharacterized protein
VTETPFFFEGPSARLFGVLHEPGPQASGLPFLLCHALGEEKLWSHRVLVDTARTLAAAGHAVLRFDCTGTGDSFGEFSATSLTSCCADIEAAADELRRRAGAGQLGLLGLRVGGSCAAAVAERRSDVESLVCWAPITNGAAYLQELLRINVTTQLAVYREVREDRDALTGVLEAGGLVNVDGYDMGPAMARELRALSVGTTPSAFRRPALLVQIDRKEDAPPAPELQRWQGRYAGAALVVVAEEPFWKEIPRFYKRASNLLAVTMTWLGHPA